MSRRRVILRVALGAALAVVLLAALALLHPRVQYVLVAAGYQLEVLWGRVPVQQAIANGQLTEDEIATARLVPGIKAHAKALGLADTGHYSTINPTWRRTVWNVSACEELAFRPRTWWFPIVGTVPYLGYFDEQAARDAGAELKAQGLDVHVRTAGAWSTLGWFEDPLLPAMLAWNESRLANTLFHELTHATVWIPGSVAFNESLANFVGEEAALDYLTDKYGADSPQVAAERARRADRDVYLRMMHDVYVELDTLYSDPDLDPDTKRARKAAVLEGLPDRARDAGFSDPERWATWLAKRPWNNATLVQHKVYNRSPEHFAAVRAESGSLSAFLERIEQIAASDADPYAALEAAAGDRLDP